MVRRKPKNKNLYATPKDNARSLKKAQKRERTGKLSQLQKAAIKESERKAAVRAAYLKANAKAKAAKAKRDKKR